jgi:hypothetical protein
MGCMGSRDAVEGWDQELRKSAKGLTFDRD